MRGLNQAVTGLTIRRVAHVSRHLLQREPRMRSLAGERIVEIRRRGKYIVTRLGSGRELLIHLRMSGRILFERRKNRREPHDHLQLEFLEKRELLIFNDVRKFGRVEFLEKSRHSGYYALGPEATDVTGTMLVPIFRSRRRPIKALLLDQEVIAGVGNIYADEALFRSRIRPQRLSRQISAKEATALAKAIRGILQLAIKNMGTTFDSYSGVNGNPGEFSRYLKVYNRGGLPCRRCGGTIKKIRAAGRGTHYCPKCQV